MLEALLDNVRELADVELVVLRDARLAIPDNADSNLEWITVECSDRVEDIFCNEIKRVDAVWPIAPETGGVLERLCQAVENAGKFLLNSSSEAVRLATSKFQTAQRLLQMKVPVVPSVILEPTKPPEIWPVVVKPDDGAGCEGIALLQTENDWNKFINKQNYENFIIQPYLEGSHQSISLLSDGNKCSILSLNIQHISITIANFHLEGCQVGALNDVDGEYLDVAEAVFRAMPGLWGYVGIDVIRCRGKLMVMEVNPRVTTSAAGLYAATGLNLAKMLLDLKKNGFLPETNADTLRSIEIKL